MHRNYEGGGEGKEVENLRLTKSEPRKKRTYLSLNSNVGIHMSVIEWQPILNPLNTLRLRFSRSLPSTRWLKIWPINDNAFEVSTTSWTKFIVIKLRTWCHNLPLSRMVDSMKSFQIHHFVEYVS